MRYAEFKSEVEQLGLEVDIEGIYIIVSDVDGNAKVSKSDVCEIDTDDISAWLDEETTRQLFHILVKFAQTTIEERHYDA